MSKCSFAQSHIEYLGHLVSMRGVEPVQDKHQAIQQWPLPCSFRAFCGFLSLVDFYRCFIKGYATMAAHLTHLLTTPQLVWSIEAQTAFQQLKDVVSSVPTLQLPNFSLSFMVETYASGTGIRAILSQSGHPITFFSKQFCIRLCLASAYVRELVAITIVVKEWRQYLLSHSFIILTDHHSLNELKSQTIQTPEQQLYLAHLLNYDYTI